jgi:hypothetical protein
MALFCWHIPGATEYGAAQHDFQLEVLKNYSNMQTYVQSEQTYIPER